MKNTHPIEVLLLGVWLALEAVAVLLTALVALLLTLACWRPARLLSVPSQSVTAPGPGPGEHPLALLAQALESDLALLTVAQLRARARAANLPRTLTRTGRKVELVNALVGVNLACS